MSKLEQAVEKMIATRRITRDDQNLLMLLFAKRDLSASDAALIRQVQEALNQGRLRVVD